MLDHVPALRTRSQGRAKRGRLDFLRGTQCQQIHGCRLTIVPLRRARGTKLRAERPPRPDGATALAGDDAGHPETEITGQAFVDGPQLGDGELGGPFQLPRCPLSGTNGAANSVLPVSNGCHAVLVQRSRAHCMAAGHGTCPGGYTADDAPLPRCPLEACHAPSETRHQVQGGIIDEVVISEGHVIHQLLAGVLQPLLLGTQVSPLLQQLLEVGNRKSLKIVTKIDL